MVDPDRAAVGRGVNAGQAVLVAGALPLFVGALLADWYYTATFEVQWINFAGWLVMGGILFAAPALIWALIEAVRYRTRRKGKAMIYMLALAALFAVGIANLLVHSKDAWATMPAALTLSILGSIFAVLSVWLGFSSLSRWTA